MQHLTRPLFTLAFLLCLHTLACAQQPAQTIQGRVVGIADGNTLTVLDATNTQHRIRLQGIDAPESRQAFGARSRENLSALVFNHQVTVEYNSRDRYQRILGKVTVEGRDVNLEQLRAGFAWLYRQYADQLSAADRIAYDQAEQSARQARRGLWADENPTPPWDYRRAGRAGNTDNSANANFGNRPPNVSLTITPNTSAPTGAIIGNRNSRIYHEPNCPNYNDVSPQNRVTFGSREEAERAGYRRARNCP